ncbi:MAG TPA: SEC-C metal-binding domain-containing protein, partial [Hyphomicrobiales bacterium]|nr:SEC-C metal-binding domain-containing protein [Hyphomicrobiales bacterium]
AGIPGAVTIATNMAGRGTDILLGGNADMRIQQELAEITDEAELARRSAEIRTAVGELKEKAKAAGGLYIIGTERHESRRIDNQLRGRSGRQGDPGHSRFFLSLEDDLMRIFGSDRMDSMLQKLGLKDGEAIVHPWVNKALEKAQQKVEGRNFDIRKNLLKFDDVMNDQRKVVFEQRIELMADEAVAETVADMRHDVIEEVVSRHIPEKAYPEQWDSIGLRSAAAGIFNIDMPIDEWAKEEGIADEEIRHRMTDAVEAMAADKTERFGGEVMRQIEKAVLLQTLDHLWREHLATLDHLRSVIGFRGYAQRDPLNEYKTEAFTLFEGLLAQLREAVVAQLARVELVEQPQMPTEADLPEMHAHHVDPLTGEDEMAIHGLPDGTDAGRSRVAADDRDPAKPETWGKVGRNEPCPCGSGKKFKHCHGALV